jgi:hypothetical protein
MLTFATLQKLLNYIEKPMTYSEDLSLTVKKKLAMAAYKELQHIKYLTKPYYKKSRALARFLKYADCLDCDTNATLKIKL